MDASLLQIREQQKATWNKFSPGWEKWNDFNMAFLKPMGDTLISMLRLKETDQVLDIATGTGEPGLTIAGLANKGTVTGTDLSEDMLAIAAKIAASRGLTNFSTKVADVCELPFPDNHFDAISCRMGFMFFPDMLLAAEEMRRVLKPGGRMATSVWGLPPDNGWIAGVMGVVSRNMAMPPPVPGAPGMFRCSNVSQMTALLQAAGFTGVKTETVSGFVDHGTPEKFWQQMQDVAAPVVNAMTNADAATREKIAREALDLFRATPGKAVLPYSAFVFCGEKGNR